LAELLIEYTSVRTRVVRREFSEFVGVVLANPQAAMSRKRAALKAVKEYNLGQFKTDVERMAKEDSGPTLRQAATEVLQYLGSQDPSVVLLHAGMPVLKDEVLRDWRRKAVIRRPFSLPR
jgi:folate-dependent phosphoribosylglycinamide formyltransferase PurN